MRRILQIRPRRLAWLCGFGLLLCLNMARSERVAVAGSVPRSSAGVTGMQFVIADLDGDQTPDLASVETAEAQSRSTSYAIRLQFAVGGDSYIGVKGPLGGLRLAVRDVNGDDRLDLILTSVMDRRVIQVLLNDGHGKFAAAEPGLFFSVGREGEFELREREPGPSDRMGLAVARSSFDADVAGQREKSSQNLDSLLAVRKRPVARSRELGLQDGRSPPPTVS